MPPGQRTVCQKMVIPPQGNVKGNRVTDEQPSACIKPNSSEREPACSIVSHDGSSILSYTDSFELMHPGTSKSTEIEDGRIISSMSKQPESSRSFETGTLKLSESSRCILPQINSTLTESGNTVCNKNLDVTNISGEPTSETQKLFSGNHGDTHNLLLLGNQAEAHKILLPGNHELPQQTISNSIPMQTSDKLKDTLLLANMQQNNKDDYNPRQNSNRLFPVNTLLSGSVTNLPFVAQSVSGQLTHLSTINQSAVKDIMNFPLNTPVVPQFIPNIQSNLTAVKVTDKNQNVTSPVKSVQASLLYPDTLYNMSANNKTSPDKSMTVPNIPTPENITGLKANTDVNLLQGNANITPNCSVNVFLKQDKISPSNEGVGKTTKRKQKRSTCLKTQLENISLPDTPLKKVRVLTPELSARQSVVTMHPVTTSCQNKDMPANAQSVTSLITNFTTPSASNTAGFSLLKVQPVVLIDDPNQGKRKIFIEPGSLNGGDTCSKNLEHTNSLLDESNGHIVSTGSSVTKHVIDGKEKDKTKKTLSSKIDEITQRITKDDTIKQHTVQTSDCDQGNNVASCSNNSRITSTGNHSNTDSLNDSPSVSTPPSVEHLHDGDPSKLKGLILYYIYNVFVIVQIYIQCICYSADIYTMYLL